MTLDDYMLATRTTAVYPKLPAHSYVVLGLAGETGEIAEKTKKTLRDSTPINLDDLQLEIGDVLWYLARLCDDYSFSLNEVAQLNLDKLADRQQRGVLGGSGDHR